MQRFSLPQLKLPVCLCLAFLAAPALADESARKPIDPNTGFARLTGQVVQTGTSEGFGNGFVIGRMGCHVLTNFHVAFGKSKNLSTGEVQFVDPVGVGHVVTFKFDLDRSTGEFRRQLLAKVVDFGNYDADTPRGILGDLALLRLDSCLGEEYGYLEFDRPVSGKRVPSGRLMTISSSQDASGRYKVLAEEGCRADEATSITGMMVMSCVGVAGMSGSMILEEGADKKWRFVGITTKVSHYANGTPATKGIYVKAVEKFLAGAIPNVDWGARRNSR